jgi:nucleotide-binding universal stress UspA family protein
MLTDQLAQAVDDARAGAESAAKRLARLIREKGKSSEAHLLEGNPADELAGYAERSGASFVCVGSRGLGRLDALLLGSVGREIANNRKTDLLVTRKRTLPEGGLDVLFATDHSDFAKRVAAKLPRLVEGRFRKVEILSVVDPDSKDVSILHAANKWSDVETGLKNWVEEQNKSLLDSLSAISEETASTVLVGHARESILERATQAGVDLVVMGAQGRSALSRLLLGSVSNYVLTRANCAVMIIRA